MVSPQTFLPHHISKSLDTPDFENKKSCIMPQDFLLHSKKKKKDMKYLRFLIIIYQTVC